ADSRCIRGNADAGNAPTVGRLERAACGAMKFAVSCVCGARAVRHDEEARPLDRNIERAAALLQLALRENRMRAGGQDAESGAAFSPNVFESSGLLLEARDVRVGEVVRDDVEV